MSLFDILKGGALGSALETLGAQARTTGSAVARTTPGGLTGLLGAGALGALLGSVGSRGLVQNAALVGAGAVAWNFYQKWAAGKEWAAGKAQQAAAPAAQGMSPDPTADLVMRAMIYAARADGSIDASERARMDAILGNMLPGVDVSARLEALRGESLDPGRIAAQIGSPEQGEDVYRLSCTVIDIDHFMERSYLDALGQTLGISAERRAALEAEASEAKQQLVDAMQAQA